MSHPSGPRHSFSRSPSGASASRGSTPTSRSPTKRPSSSLSARHGHVLRPATVSQSPGCFLAGDARLEGVLNFSRGCILHPRSHVVCAPGSTLSFGEGCVVEENAIVNFPGPGHADVGSHNVFMAGSRVDLVPGLAVGSWNTFSPKSQCAGVRVTDHCTIGAGTALGPTHPSFTRTNAQTDDDGDAPMGMGIVAQPTLQSRTVVYGAASEMRIADGSGEESEMAVRRSATQYLREVLPKYTKARPAI